jgi:Zn2+/Cd2+-exporting ATPase
LETIEFTQFESVTGEGLQAKRGGTEVFLGKREWVAEQVKNLFPRPAQRGEGQGEGPTSTSSPQPSPPLPTEEREKSIPGTSEVWVVAGDLLGRVILRDDIAELRQAGLRSVVLTGDRRASAEHLRTELKLDDVRAELKPEQKVAAIRELSGQGNRVAMIGDGVNDAPSLAVAHIGVAMGARGSDAALEQADVVLMHDRLENFLAAFRLSQRARSVIRQNLFISLGTVVVLVGFALAGKIPLTIGVVGHEGSTVVVVMNSLRLLFGGGKKS